MEDNGAYPENMDRSHIYYMKESKNNQSHTFDDNTECAVYYGKVHKGGISGINEKLKSAVKVFVELAATHTNDSIRPKIKKNVEDCIEAIDAKKDYSLLIACFKN